MLPSLPVQALITPPTLVPVDGFLTELSFSGRVSHLVPQANGLRRALLLWWLVGLGAAQGLVPLSFSAGGGVLKPSIGSGSCVMALRGTSNILGALGALRRARYVGAFASLPPSKTRHPWGGADWYRDQQAPRRSMRTRVIPPTDAAAASPTTPATTKRISAKKGKAKNGKTRATAASVNRTPPSSGTGVGIGSEAGSGKVLVIVESPAKAKTISRILEKARGSGGGCGSSINFDGYTVDACNGHVRDLVGKRKDVPPELKEKTKKWDVIGVDVENSFEPLYVPNPSKKAIVNRLRKAASKSDEIVLATDGDREGEAISWHLLQVLEPTVPVKRAVFHEITLEALTKAFENTGDIDYDLVQAQEARRILDRLAGFTLTPVVWSIIAPGLSAGRVQSVALSMVVERERKRLLFKPAEYWDVMANMTVAGGRGNNTERSRPFEARLVSVGSKAVVSGKDFDPDTGELKEGLNASGVEFLGSQEAGAVAAAIATGSASSLWVLSAEKRRVRRKPPAPFITSTLQQEASRKLGLGVSQTMRAAQALYEAGYITYMRTDRPVLSDAAAGVAKGAVREAFGEEYLRQGKAKKMKVKGSQEAHEAIRPALLSNALPSGTPSIGGDANVETGTEGANFLRPSELPIEGLEPKQRALYELVYRRTLASAMAESEADFTTVLLEASGVFVEGKGKQDLVFKATGKNTVFDGFLKVYEEDGGGEGEADDGGKGEDDHMELPLLKEGSEVFCENASPAGHHTSPPRRYSEATFVRELEAQGVGRPSTYATILETLRNRAYVNMQGRSLTPSLTGFVVAILLQEHFPDFTDTDFTAQMENKLDEIARGRMSRVEYLSEYYLGEEGLKASVQKKTRAIDRLEAKRARLPGLESMENRCAIFVGPYGGYLVPNSTAKPSKNDEKELTTAAAASTVSTVSAVSTNGGSERTGDDGEHGAAASAVTLPYVAQENLELLTPHLVERCLDSSYKGGDLLGQHPETGEDIRIRMGRYGPYLECGNVTRPAIPHPSSSSTTAASRKGHNDPSLRLHPPHTPPPSLLENPDVLQQPASQRGLQSQCRFPSLSPDNAAILVAEECLTSVEGISHLGDGNSSDSTDPTSSSDAAPHDEDGEDGEAGPWYSSISLERAVGLLSLPRVICDSHPTEGGPIEVGIGRYGVYVKHRELYKVVPKGVDVLDVDEALAVELVDQMIQRNKERPTIELGTWREEKVLVKYGRWGRFVYCGGTQANLPAKYKKMPTTTTTTIIGVDSNNNFDEISLEEAIELIEAKRAKEIPPARRRHKAAASAAAASRKSSKESSAASSRKKKSGTDGGGGGGARRNLSSSARAHGEDSLLKKGANGSPRPLSGFFRFCKECREEQAHAQGLLAEDARAAGRRSTLTVKELSERWKALPDEGRARHNAAAAVAMAEWKTQTGRSGKRSLEADLSTLS